MMRAAFMLGTAALATATAASAVVVPVKDVAEIDFVKGTYSAVNFTVYTHITTANFETESKGLTKDILRKLNGQVGDYGIEWTNVKPALDVGISTTKATARFYNTKKPVVPSDVSLKEAVEALALKFYQNANEAAWEIYEDKVYKAWEVANAAAKVAVLVSREKHEPAVATPVPAVTPVPTTSVADDFHTAMNGKVRFAEVDCMRTNLSQADMPVWARESRFEGPNFYARCYRDETTSTIAMVGLFCGGWVVIGMFIMLFILTCSGTNQGKPAPQ